MNKGLLAGLAVLCAGLTGALAYEAFRPVAVNALPAKPSRQIRLDPPRAMIPLPEQDFTVINARPVFNPKRAPFPDATLPEGSKGSASDLQLVGVVQGPEKSIALLKNTTTLQTVNVSIGDFVSGWRVQAITPVHVVLSSASGNIVLPLNDPTVGAPSGGNVAAMSSQPDEAKPQPTAPTPASAAPTPPSSVAAIATPSKAASAKAALPLPTGHGNIAPEALRSAPIDPSTGEPTL